MILEIEIVDYILVAGTEQAIVAYNHPGSTVEPSEDDLRLTKELKKALALIDVDLLDHLVIAESKVVSFAEEGII